eukprot:jgi/Galph1/1059/GphlegSOOS_G5764.1
MAGKATNKFSNDDDEQYESTPYSWELEIDRSWEALEEDESGRIKDIDHIERVPKRQRQRITEQNVRRGLIRYVVLMIDLSVAAKETDLKPCRGEACLSCCEAFIRNYFDENPLSQLSLVFLRDGIAEKQTPMSTNLRQPLEALKKAIDKGFWGVCSLQNGLEVAVSMLSSIPSYGSREIILLYNSLSSCDPGDIHETIDKVRQQKIRCSVVGTAAELYILRYLCSKTGGTYYVSMNENHLQALLLEFTTPPASFEDNSEVTLVQMGFPVLKTLKEPKPCLNDKVFRSQVFVCPRCECYYGEVPIECVLCGLMLVPSTHLARSYHHIFPVANFTEQSCDNLQSSQMEACFGCKVANINQSYSNYICTRCQRVFCSECDSFIHDNLFNCPGCDIAGLKQTSVFIRKSI